MGSPVLAQRDRDTYSNASANALEVVGQVRLVGTGLPANRVSVRLERFGGGVVDQMDTDSGGRFRFANLQRGYYKVLVNAPGFRPVQQDADLQVVFRAYLVFELSAEKPGVIDLNAAGEEEVAHAQIHLSGRVTRRCHRKSGGGTSQEFR